MTSDAGAHHQAEDADRIPTSTATRPATAMAAITAMTITAMGASTRAG